MKAITHILIGFVLGMLTVSLMMLPQLQKESGAQEVKELTEDIRTDTIRDTVRISEPVFVERLKVRTDTVRLPLATSSAISDSALVQVPIEQKVYSDSTYRAWVSGYNPILDSIEVRPVTIHRTVEITRTATKNRRWGLGITAGVGVTPKNIQAYIGIGISYDLVNW